MSFGQIHLTHPDGRAVVIDINQAELTLGRAAEVDITLNDGLVSKRHARITVDAHGVWLSDLGSTNGTLVDGIRLTAHQPVHLQDGMRIELGDTRARFSAAPPILPPPPEAAPARMPRCSAPASRST